MPVRESGDCRCGTSGQALPVLVGTLFDVAGDANVQRSALAAARNVDIAAHDLSVRPYVLGASPEMTAVRAGMPDYHPSRR